jgi:hypothetical protein
VHLLHHVSSAQACSPAAAFCLCHSQCLLRLISMRWQRQLQAHADFNHCRTHSLSLCRVSLSDLFISVLRCGGMVEPNRPHNKPLVPTRKGEAPSLAAQRATLECMRSKNAYRSVLLIVVVWATASPFIWSCDCNAPGRARSDRKLPLTKKGADAVKPGRQSLTSSRRAGHCWR